MVKTFQVAVETQIRDGKYQLQVRCTDALGRTGQGTLSLDPSEFLDACLARAYVAGRVLEYVHNIIDREYFGEKPYETIANDVSSLLGVCV